MAATVSLAEAAALDEQFGTRIDVNHEGDRWIMADALRDRFGISHGAARTLIDTHDQSHTTRYVADRASQKAATGATYSGNVGPCLDGFGPAAAYGTIGKS